MAGKGTEVGKITIRVVPDTDGFRDSLRKQLLGADEDVEVDIKPGEYDPREFRAQVRKMSQDAQATIDVDADTSEATKQLDLFQKRNLADVGKHIKKLETKIGLTADDELFRRQAESAAKRLTNDIRAEIPLDPVLASDVRTKITKEVQALADQADRLKIQVGPGVDLDKKQYKLQQFLAKEENKRWDEKDKAILDGWKKEAAFNDKVADSFQTMMTKLARTDRTFNEKQEKADQDYTKRLNKYHQDLYENKHKQRIADFREDLRMMKMREDEARQFVKNFTQEGAGLDEIFRPHHKVEVDLDVRRNMFRGFSGRLVGMFDGLGTKLGRSLVGSMETAVDKSGKASNAAGGILNKLLPSFGSGINIGGYALIFGALLDVAAPLVGLLSTAFLSLPGLIAAVATPIAAVTLGLDGFKKAAEKIKPQFDNLRQSMSDVAESEFSPVLERVANTVFPMLERSLPSVTTGLRHLADGVVDALNNPDNKLEQTISNIGGALASAKPGVDGFVSAFLQLANSLSEKFPAITQWFNDAGTRFDAWVAKLSADGTLSSAFSGLGESLKIILDTITELGNKGLDFMKDPQNLQMFKEQLQGIGTALKDILEWSKGVNENFQLLKQIWRPVQAIADVMLGDGEGAWANTRDFFKYFGDDGEKAGAEAGTRTGEAFNNSMKNVLTGQGGNVGAGGLDDLLKNVAGGGAPGQAPVVPPPNLEPAKAKVTEYQSFIDSVTQQVRGSLSQATSGESLPAPNFEAFKAAWSELPVFVSNQVVAIRNAATSMGTAVGGALSSVTAAAAPVWDGLKIQAITAFNQINSAASQLPGQIAGSLGQLNGVGLAAGQSLVAGLRSGIEGAMPGLLGYVDTIAGQIAAHKGPLPYDRKVLQPNGEALMEGLGTGLATGFEDVLAKAKSMAGQISDAVNEGISLDNLLGGEKLPDLQKMLDTIDEQRQLLKVQKNNTTDKSQKKILSDQMSQLQTQRDNLALIKKQESNTDKYGNKVKTVDEMWTDAQKSLYDMPFNFARANLNQGMSDLGIGGGALTGLAGGLMDWATQAGKQFIFNVNNMDEALAARQRIANVESIQWRR